MGANINDIDINANKTFENIVWKWFCLGLNKATIKSINSNPEQFQHKFASEADLELL